MASPFPGMDPYLESIWADVHIRLVPIFGNLLTPLLAPKYVTDLGSRVVVERLPDDDLDGRVVLPDVAVLHPERVPVPTVASPPGVTPPPLRLKTPVELPTRLVTLYIREAATMKLVTVIELLSPVNKRGEGRREYLQRRNEVLDSAAHLVEIDLVRQGRPMPFLGELPDTPVPRHGEPRVRPPRMRGVAHPTPGPAARASCAPAATRPGRASGHRRGTASHLPGRALRSANRLLPAATSAGPVG